jgi:hypothetical protein
MQYAYFFIRYNMQTNYLADNTTQTKKRKPKSSKRIPHTAHRTPHTAHRTPHNQHHKKNQKKWQK